MVTLVWPMAFPTAVAGPGPLLECGHIAAPVERLRQSDEKWCSDCCRWEFEVPG